MNSAIIISLVAIFFILWKKNGESVHVYRRLPKGSFPDLWRIILSRKVFFYQKLGEQDQRHFEKRVHVFLENTKIIGIKTVVNDEDRILVAASAIIPIFRFPDWNYKYLHEVILYPNEFNVIGSRYKAIGLVGYGHMEGRMILSKEALHAGFDVTSDKRNVGLHEFSHLIDKQDGVIDGIPASLLGQENIKPWLELIREKTEEIIRKNSTIRDYAATNNAEFLAVVTEYFYERPNLLKEKHPRLYQALVEIFDYEDSKSLKWRVGRNISKAKITLASDPCPCGSGKKFRICCKFLSIR